MSDDHGASWWTLWPQGRAVARVIIGMCSKAYLGKLAWWACLGKRGRARVSGATMMTLLLLLLLLLAAIVRRASFVLGRSGRLVHRIGAVGPDGYAGSLAGVGSMCGRDHFQRGERNERDA